MDKSGETGYLFRDEKKGDHDNGFPLRNALGNSLPVVGPGRCG